MHTHRRAIAAIASFALLGGSGVAFAAAGGPTQITVQDAPALTAGQKAPFDAAGVKAIRRGKAIPSGYVLIGQQVQIKRGARSAGASLLFTCPDRKTLRTFATVGDAGFTATRNYPGHRQTVIESFAPPSRADATGTVYAICR